LAILSKNLSHPSTPPDIAERDAARQATLAAKLATLYPGPVSLILELGCGHGHFLTAFAAAHPQIPCLGIDRATFRTARAVRKQERLNLANAAFFKADAAETLAVLPPSVRFAGIFVLFPDPWPKKRHHRRRLLQPELLDALAVRANPGAWLAVRTDHEDYFTWARAQISTHPHWRLAPEIPWPFEHSSVFQDLHETHHSLMAAQR
jgi:tRNA (guanine-N7-)-methyltransferase